MIDRIAGEGRDIVDFRPNQSACPDGAEIDMVDGCCLRIGGLFGRYCGCR